MNAARVLIFGSEKVPRLWLEPKPARIGTVSEANKKTPTAKEIDERRDQQIRWSQRLQRFNDEASLFDATGRLISAGDYLDVAARQLIRVGESEQDDALLLVARICQDLEDTIHKVLEPRTNKILKAHGFPEIPPPTKDERRKLLTALNVAHNTIEKTSASRLRGIKVPTLKERSAAAIQCRDNIANNPRLTASVAAADLVVACHIGFGARFLWNKQRRSQEERRLSWTDEAQRVIDRADLNAPEGRLKAATRIVMNCAKVEGMTPQQAKDLFKHDSAQLILQGRHQVKKGRSRD